jgi:hypothetical protein
MQQLLALVNMDNAVEKTRPTVGQLDGKGPTVGQENRPTVGQSRAMVHGMALSLPHTVASADRRMTAEEIYELLATVAVDLQPEFKDAWMKRITEDPTLIIRLIEKLRVSKAIKKPAAILNYWYRLAVADGKYADPCFAALRQKLLSQEPDPSELPAEAQEGFPETEKQAAAYAESCPCPEAFAVSTWNGAMARGKRDWRGLKIESWPHFLRAASLYEAGANSQRSHYVSAFEDWRRKKALAAMTDVKSPSANAVAKPEKQNAPASKSIPSDPLGPQFGTPEYEQFMQSL